MFDHVGVVFDDLERSGDFYKAVLREIGLELLEDHTQPDRTGWLVFSSGAREAPFFVVAAGRPSFWKEGHVPGKSPVHIAFRAPSRSAVDNFHAVGLQHGATDNGKPGIRRGRYYCAFLFDYNGNNVEAGVYG